MRILFLAAWYPSEVTPLSGPFVREHARAAALFNDVTVVHACDSLDQKVRGLYQVDDSVEDGIRTVRIRYRNLSPGSHLPISRATRLWITLRYLSRFMNGEWRPDVVHAHVYSAGVPAVVLGKAHGVPVVVTEHWTGFVLRELTWERRFAARFALNRARAVLPVSNHLSAEIRRYGIKTPFHVVPNVVDTRLFRPPPGPGRGRNGPKRLLLVANLSEQKGVSHLLQSLKRVAGKRTDFRLDIVGEGAKGASREGYEEMSRELGLESMVAFHGSKPKEEVAEFMKGCDFFVQPSLWETFGVVYIEAMACGKPVIACDIPGPNEFINKDVGILVPPADVEALAKAIDFMLDHHGDYSSEHTANFVRERFSYEVVGRKLDTIYREVVGA